MKTQYILICGADGAGKTTVANELVSHLNGNKRPAIKESFAAPLKHLVSVALGHKYSDLNKDRTYPELNGDSVRMFLEHLHRKFLCENYGEDVLGKWLMSRVLRYPDRKPEFVVVDDAGIQAQHDAIPLGQRRVVLVLRPDRTHYSGGRKMVTPDFIVDNQNGPMVDLWRRIEEIGNALRNDHDVRSYGS